MGMTLDLFTLPDGAIDSVLATPALIWRVVAPNDLDILVEALRSPAMEGFPARRFGEEESDSVPLPELEFADGEVVCTGLDKAWHGIHFLLTGTAWEGDPPLNFLVSGGTPVGAMNVGDGPARVFRSNEVAEIRKALGKLQEDDLRQRFQPDVMMKKKIYPAIWNRDPNDDDTPTGSGSMEVAEVTHELLPVGSSAGAYPGLAERPPVPPASS